MHDPFTLYLTSSVRMRLLVCCPIVFIGTTYCERVDKQWKGKQDANGDLFQGPKFGAGPSLCRLFPAIYARFRSVSHFFRLFLALFRSHVALVRSCLALFPSISRSISAFVCGHLSLTHSLGAEEFTVVHFAGPVTYGTTEVDKGKFLPPSMWEKNGIEKTCPQVSD